MDQLGVNKIGKTIKKSPLLHNPNFSNGVEALPQSQVYNISKNGFTSILQQLTRESLPQNTRIRPAALTPINRPRVPVPVMDQPPMQPLVHGSESMIGLGDQCWSNTAESHGSVYMRYLQSSLDDSVTNENQMQPSLEPRPLPHSHNHLSPRFNDSASSSMPILPTPRFNGPPQPMHNHNNLPSPRFNGRGILPSPPTSQCLLQSPTDYRSFPSLRSPYPLLSPGVRYPSPLTPRNVTFSSMDQPGILGPGKFPQPPASPGLMFPSSPFGVLPNSSPRWRGY